MKRRFRWCFLLRQNPPRTKLFTISKIFFCFFAFFLLFQFFYSLPKPQQANANGTGWYNSSWLYRKPITVDNTSTSTLTNYQAQVSVTYDSHMQSDFDDIRFTDSDGTTLLDHWRETYTTSTSATFWVKVPSIATSSTATIYMYYGNSAASSNSNSSLTFLRQIDLNSSYYPNLFNQVKVEPQVKYGSNPILTKGASGAWDDRGIRDQVLMTDPYGTSPIIPTMKPASVFILMPMS